MRPCPSCGEAAARDLVVALPLARPETFPGNQETRVYTCGRCGMGFSDDGITQEHLDRYYAERSKYGDLGVYASGESGGLDTEAPWELARANALADFIAAHAGPQQRVLDIGCSTGTLLALLRNRGFERLSGIEPLPSAVYTAREHRSLDVREGWITDIQDEDAFDVITFSHVLEHVLELRAVIDRARDLLADGGLLIVEVPDASRYAQFVHIPFQDFNTEHINHFSPAMLAAVIGSSGFDLEERQDDVAGSGPHHPYPVTRGAWRKSPGIHPRVPKEHDRRAHRRALGDYCTTSEGMFTEIDQRTVELVGHEPFAIWGAGQFTMKWMRRPGFPIDGLRILVDQAPSRVGLTLGAHTVLHPSAVPAEDWPATILVGSAYAAGSISAAIRDRAIDAQVASPFQQPSVAPAGSHQ